ncbi:MAG TPA: hypothetical protein VIN06_05255 [Devosia sp.]
MRTNIDLSPDLDEVTDGDLRGYFRPRDIADDPTLTVSRKRELLAYWASDIHAVTGAPALRAIAAGPTVSIDDIMDALKSLDARFDPPPAMGGFAGIGSEATA